MSDQVLERTLSSFLQLPLPAFSFAWQGGEPTLMGVDFFRRVTQVQERWGKSAAVVSNTLQTNATLIDTHLAAHLAQYRFLVGVSLDGPRDVHDRYRRDGHANGSFDQVLRGIELLQRHGVAFNVLVLVSKANVAQAARVYRFLRELGILWQQYIPCVEFNAAGKPRSFSIQGREWGRFLCELYDEWYPRDTRSVSIRGFDSLLGALCGTEGVCCQMERDCRHYLVVEHNGDVYPCDFFVQSRLRLGNVLEQSWESIWNGEPFAAFGRMKREWNVRCSSCRYLHLCHGDCLKHRLPVPGADPRSVSHLCAGWRAFYEHALPGFERLAREVRARTAQPPSVCSIPPGRNAPCPCGSGRKYKQCCLAAGPREKPPARNERRCR